MIVTRPDEPIRAKIPWRLRRSFRTPFALATMLLATQLLAMRTEAIVFQVNSTADTSDNAQGDGQCSTGGIVVDPAVGPRPECTLRGAIEEANAWPGRDEVRFTSRLIYDADGVATFNPESEYDQITGPIDIDGTTAPTYDPLGPPRVVIVGKGAYHFDALFGLYLVTGAADSTIRGISIGGFAMAIWLAGTDGVWIDRCAIGIHSPDGSHFTLLPTQIGIQIHKQANDTWIGMKVENNAFQGLGNTISGNWVGITIDGSNTHVIGNKIGTDSSGMLTRGRSSPTSPQFSLGNRKFGIFVGTGLGLEIGRVLTTGTAPNLTHVAEGNLISNNGEHGIDIVESSNQPTHTGMKIVANQIGTDTTGMLDFGNGYSGIYVSAAAADLVIGGSGPAEANQVAGNDGDGIELGFGGVGDTTIENNLVGIGSDGVSALANGFQAIRIDGGDPVLVKGNTVGHSPFHGILIGNDPLQNVGLVRVIDNFVGATPSGTAIGNTLSGIRVEAGDVTLRGNTVGENATGIDLADGSRLTGVFDNYIGTDALGRDLGNTDAGLLVTSTVGGNTIGGVDEGNVIGWNGGSGIVIDQAANDNLVVANSIGVHPNGVPIPNGLHGIRLRDGIGIFHATIGSNLTISTRDFGARANRIRYNFRDAISMQDGTTAAIRGNEIADNGQISIDLNEDGNSPNDFGDVDLGANRRQNSPELDTTGVRYDEATGELHVEYRVTSDPGNSAYPLTIDFYLADATGFQPKTYLGSDTYQAADAHLQRRVQFVTAEPIPNGNQRIVATATTAINETSEISAPVPEPGVAGGLAAGGLALAALAGRRIGVPRVMGTRTISLRA